MSLSTIDLVYAVLNCPLLEAARWLCARFEIPLIEKNAKLSHPERWNSGFTKHGEISPASILVLVGLKPYPYFEDEEYKTDD